MAPGRDVRLYAIEPEALVARSLRPMPPVAPNRLDPLGSRLSHHSGRLPIAYSLRHVFIDGSVAGGFSDRCGGLVY